MSTGMQHCSTHSDVSQFWELTAERVSLKKTDAVTVYRSPKDKICTAIFTILAPSHRGTHPSQLVIITEIVALTCSPHHLSNSAPCWQLSASYAAYS